MIGGIVSFFVSIYMIYVVYARGKQMLMFEEPTITSIEEQFTYDVGKISVLEVAKPLFEI